MVSAIEAKLHTAISSWRSVFQESQYTRFDDLMVPRFF